MYHFFKCIAEEEDTQEETKIKQFAREERFKKQASSPYIHMIKIYIPFSIVIISGLIVVTVLLYRDMNQGKDQQHTLHVQQKTKCQLGSSQEILRAWTGSRGRSFLVSFIQSSNHAKKSNRTILVLAENDFNITATVSENQNSNLITVSSERSGNTTIKKIEVHNSLVPSYLAIESKAIAITVSSMASVLSMNDIDFNSDSTTVFPVDKLSTHYVVSTASPKMKYRSFGSHFTVAANTDNTKVSIRLVIDTDANITFEGKMYGNDDEIRIVLNMYQTFQVGLDADLSGTTIIASHPVAIFAGNACNRMGEYGSCSMLMEMVPPTEKLDKIFIVPPLVHRYKSQLRIVSPFETEIQYSIDGNKTSAILSRNKKFDFFIRENEIATIEGLGPLLVNSFAHASVEHDVYGDPFMITIPGINQYLNEYNLIVPGNFNFSFATFILKNSFPEYLEINETNPYESQTCNFSTISVGEFFYSVWTLSVPSGVMKVRTTYGSPFGVIIYGLRDNDGHGYAGNAILATCKKGWIRIENSCNFISPKRVTFEDALKACKDETASLTEHQNTKIEKVVGLQLREEEDVGVWIAVKHIELEDVYVYVSNGSRVTNENWAKGQPLGGKHYNCAAAKKDENWKWVAYPCRHTFYYVCKKHI
ncbi:IgGFc-binding protein-like [Saccostrea cucullata]|uniref:IgGFc-binding protein-like n=1 Tax=Saccostrea cuccullata TaxID=36930 RepID=UPI002ED174E0